MEYKIMEHPLISVVTVVFNAVRDIEETILSVINQTYKNIEYIIIDGGSTDGTVDIIKKYTDRITYWISEPDKGIYDAMNKGIDKATGEWINFMNVGDYFDSNDVVSRMSVAFSGNVDVVYGDCNVIEKNGNRIWRAQNIKLLSCQMPFSHQSTFVKTCHMKGNFYELKYKYASDYHFLLGCYLRGLSFKYVEIPVSRVLLNEGMTAEHKMKSMREVYKIHLEYGFPKGHSLFLFYKSLCYYVLINNVKKLLPSSVLLALLRLKK